MSELENNQIIFPVEWTYRIIAFSQAKNVEEDIAKIMSANNLNFAPKKGLTSSGGKYVTYSFTMTLLDHEMMNAIANTLSEIEGVKVVI